MKTNIIKKKGIDETLDGYRGQQVEEEKEMQVEETPFSALTAKLKEMMEYNFSESVHKHKFMHHPFLPEVLLPEEIDLFLRTTCQFETQKHYKTNTGIFISRLLQNSYMAGHNDFHLQIEDLPPIDSLCSYLIGARNNPVAVTVEGDAGRYFGSLVEYGMLNIFGGVEPFCGEDAQYTTFRTDNYITSETLLIHVTGHKDTFCTRNKIVLIKEDGSERTVRNYNRNKRLRR